MNPKPIAFSEGFSIIGATPYGQLYTDHWREKKRLRRFRL